MKKRLRLYELARLGLMDDALAQLRALPAAAWCWFLGGAAPFILALMYFWLDMGVGRRATWRCLAGALVLAGLYLWYRVCLANVCQYMRRRLDGDAAQAWSWRSFRALAAAQCRVQPWVLGLSLVSACTLVLYPLGHGVALAATALGWDDDAKGGIGQRALTVCRHSVKDLLLLHVILLPAALVLALNCAIAVNFLPEFLRMLTGLDTVFTTSGFHLINSSFVMLTLLLTHVGMELLWLALLSGMAFRVEAIGTGEDILAALRRYQGRLPHALGVLLAAVALTGGGVSALAADAVGSAELDGRIDRVLARGMYAWRLPAPPSEAEREWSQHMALWAESIAGVIRDVVDDVRDALDRIRNWWRRFVPDWDDGPGGAMPHPGWFSRDGLMVILHWAALLLAVLLVILAVRLLRRTLAKRRRRAAQAVGTTAAVAEPTAEAVLAAEERSPDGWVEQAEEHARKGQWRQALRSWYLAHIAALAERELLRLARGKSNHDYFRELRQRGRIAGQFFDDFVANGRLFDAVWYGRLVADAALVASVQARVRTAVTAPAWNALPPATPAVKHPPLAPLAPLASAIPPPVPADEPADVPLGASPPMSAAKQVSLPVVPASPPELPAAPSTAATTPPPAEPAAPVLPPTNHD
ncbi:MAG: hypothetical protein PHT80_08110 [Lentisphaeria bacterium]|nr:hypothetical protein [Lentisphaeria bacterium]